MTDYSLINSTAICDKTKTVCFTGHRPEKLPDSGAEGSSITRVMKSMLYKAILDSIDEGCNCFITGAARGIDLWAAEIIMSEKASGRDIKLIGAIPYRGHGSNFKEYDKWVYGNLFQNADEIVYVCDSYNKLCMKKRNEYMVKNSGKLIAVVSDYKSGTGQTIRLAMNEGIKVHIIDANKIAETVTELQDEDFDLL